MQLWEDQEIVDVLKHILKDYDYLEYDEAVSRHINGLQVKVTRLDADRDISVASNICQALGQATERYFRPPTFNTLHPPTFNTHGYQNLNKKWTSFNLHEQSFHKNVKITYPSDRTKPVEVECYAGEYMQVNINDPSILRYADEKGEIKFELRVVDRKTGSVVRRDTGNNLLNELKNILTDIAGKTIAELIKSSR